MILYPEGGTTNGTHLLKFKKGAFHGLNSVQPIIIRYSSPFLDIENCVYNFFAMSILCASCPYSSVTCIEMPIFKPNDYFFEHHQQEGEEKWETYARVVRELMGEVSGMKLIDMTIEDKYEYKKLLYPKHKGKISD